MGIEESETVSAKLLCIDIAFVRLFGYSQTYGAI